MQFMERKKIWFLISIILLIPGIISLIVWQLNLGIDFKGGSLAEYRVERGESSLEEAQDRGQSEIKKAYEEQSLENPIIQTDESTPEEVRFFVKSQSIETEKHNSIVRRLGESQPKIEELSFETIDPQVGEEVTRRAIWAIIVASAAIIIYIATSFRGVPKPATSWQFGVFAVIALLHDVLFIVGFYSLMGHFAGWEVNAEFVTAALTVMGFSVHDTIVVFDRLRENLKRLPSDSFTEVANISVAQTIARSLNTSLTVILVLLAVALLGGTNIRPFTVTLLIGIAAGTFSSIFVATPLLDWWLHKKFTLRFPRLNKKRTKSVTRVRT